MKTTDKKPRPTWRPFEEARDFARNLGLTSIKNWDAWSKSGVRPNDIPAHPNRVYADKGWIEWSDWLGHKIITNQNRSFRPFKEAKTFIHTLGLKDWKEWSIWAKSNNRPRDIPSNPYNIYKNQGWIDLGDWLGTGRISNRNIVYRSFEDAREFVHNLSISSHSDLAPV